MGWGEDELPSDIEELAIAQQLAHGTDGQLASLGSLAQASLSPAVASTVLTDDAPQEGKSDSVHATSAPPLSPFLAIAIRISQVEKWQPLLTQLHYLEKWNDQQQEFRQLWESLHETDLLLEEGVGKVPETDLRALQEHASATREFLSRNPFSHEHWRQAEALMATECSWIKANLEASDSIIRQRAAEVDRVMSVLVRPGQIPSG